MVEGIDVWLLRLVWPSDVGDGFAAGVSEVVGGEGVRRVGFHLRVRRVHAVLARWGEMASPELVRVLMRGAGLVACQPVPWRHSLTVAGLSGPIPDLVARDFTAAAPGTKMVGDITYIPTWEGWLFLATVIDCHTKAVVGWATDDNYKTPLIVSAVEMAVRNQTVIPGAIFDSGPGSNYTSAEFADALDRYVSGSLSAGPVFVMIIRWRNRFSLR